MDKHARLVRDYRDLYNKMVWLNRARMEEGLREYKASEVHCIEYIGGNVDPNVTKLAEAFYMTRGAMSKTTQKLIRKGIIESYQKPDNKKEIYFRLTPQGKAVYHVHEGLHEEFRKRDKAVFDKVTKEQFDAMLGFVRMYNKHLDAEIQRQGLSRA
jgi:DNA-binding MarR family transcriptional regulator